ncbi:hypothetical protein HN51_039954 [Arachis hypogaea]|uniref:uncharacterized protein n=1 Tax=Arachis hypogaea TaxID=3818 RepID=UPI0007AF718B|nr:uncharacterized protein LOC107646144 isoform X1 [Arachis ipaensis]XP_025663104.1 uncharacterized protein LOC112758610 [Arachis hypogaea]
MPLFEITNAQLSLQCPLYSSLRAPMPYHINLKGSSISLTFGNDHCLPCAWNKLRKENLSVVPFRLPRGTRTGTLLIKAVATFEPKILPHKRDECTHSTDLHLATANSAPGVHLDSCDEESQELDEREKLRRMRISKANKGNTPWNKGRKHSPETLLKIRERTRLAMQNPKIKMKLANLGHAQTTETRLKIGAGVKMGWDRRLRKKMLQEACCFEWQNLIAEASRKGYAEQEELQWNSYGILDKQLKQEWSECVEQRKQMVRPPGSKRAPKSPEQRRKIAEAIAAKWADPGYRERVCSGLAKYHGGEAGAEKKPRRRPSDGSHSKKKKPIMRKDTNTSTRVGSSSKIGTKSDSLKKITSPVFKDPFVNSKLEMIKNIRAQRAAAETGQAQVIERARLLIAEAEKAAKALEVAATKSPIAQASLIESRKLIAEAIQALESIDAEEMSESDVSSVASSDFNEEGSASEFLSQSLKSHVNGHKAFSSNDYKFSEDFGELSKEMQVDGDLELGLTSTNGCITVPCLNSHTRESGPSNEQGETEEDESRKCETQLSPSAVEIQPTKDEAQCKSPSASKKWVRGRLVEVA